MGAAASEFEEARGSMSAGSANAAGPIPKDQSIDSDERTGDAADSESERVTGSKPAGSGNSMGVGDSGPGRSGEPKPTAPVTSAAPDPRDLPDHGVPERLVYAAIIVGLILTAVGGYIAMQAVHYTPGVHFAALIACAGLAIVLIAFGGRAIGSWKSWAVGGAAAAAPFLFILQWNLQPSPMQILRGELQGTRSFQQVAVWTQDGPLYVRQHRAGQPFQFVGLSDQIATTRTFRISVTNERGKDPLEFEIFCIDADILRSALRASQNFILSVRLVEGQGTDARRWAVFDQENKEHGRFNDDDCSNSNQRRPTSSSVEILRNGQERSVEDFFFPEPAPKH